MTTIRIIKQKNFSIISNVALRDSSLSLKAKGLWAYLLSMPDDWQIHVNHLVKTCTDGKHAIYAALKELKCAGYIEIEIIRVDGRIKKHDYIIHEEPIKTEGNDTKFLLAENQDIENQDVENQTLLNTKNNNNKNNVQEHLPDPPPEHTAVKLSLSPLIKKNNKKKTTVSAPYPNIQQEIPAFQEHNMKKIMEIIPEGKKCTAIKRVIERALNTYSTDDIENAIRYTNKYSTGDSMQYKSYLGKCLEGHWAEGFENFDENKNELFIQSRRIMPSSLLEIDAKNGCKISAQILMERKQHQQNEKRYLL